MTVDRLSDDRRWCDRRHDLESRHEGDIVERRQVGGVGHRDDERVAAALDRDELVPFRELCRNKSHDVGVRGLGQGYDAETVLLRQGQHEFVLGKQAHADQDRAQLLPRSILLDERPAEVLMRDLAACDQDFVESPPDRRWRGCLGARQLTRFEGRRRGRRGGHAAGRAVSDRHRRVRHQRSQRVAVRGKKGNGSTALIEGVDQLQHPEHCARCVEDRHQEYRDGPVIETCIHVRVELVRPVRRNVIRVGHIQLSRREPDEAGDAALVQLKRFWEQLARQLALAVPPREGLVLDDREAKPVALADVDRSAFGAREPPRLGEHTFENPREFFRCARDDSVVDVVLQERAPSARDLTVRLPPLDDVDLGSFGVDLREHASERRGVVVVALERLPDDRQRREPRYDPEARPQGDVVERGDVGGVGDGERHLVERPAGRHNAVLAGGRARDQLDDLWGDLLGERDFGDAVPAREEMDEPGLGNHPEADQDLAELPARPLLLGQRLVELVLCDQGIGDEQIAEPLGGLRLARAARCHRRPAGAGPVAALALGFENPRDLRPFI